ncbi:hypothetical protein [Mesorhizobium captivum]|uniref:hypothetical protein n=1 Tax=Mesorhizobium captivum TaxID=3072319 RepID=UPI003D321C12
MFIRREGKDSSRPPFLIGSHLDSQLTGGRFDGALSAATLSGRMAMKPETSTFMCLRIQSTTPIRLGYLLIQTTQIPKAG